MKDPKRIRCIWFSTDRRGKKRARFWPVGGSMRTFPLPLGEAEMLAAGKYVTVVEFSPLDFSRGRAPETISERAEAGGR
jgi:hypothetical protein